MVDEKVTHESRSIKSWTTGQINKVKEWFHVPGVIAAPAADNTPATYPNYLKFIKETARKTLVFEESIARLTNEIANNRSMHMDFALKSVEELNKAKLSSF